MKKIIILLLVIISANLYAQDLKSIKDTEKLSYNIIDDFYKTEFRKGLKTASQYWPLPESELNSLGTQIISQWVIIEERFGKSTGYELIQKEAIGTSFIRYYFLHKFEKHAIYWSLTYYKPENNWVINSISFQDDLESLFRPVK